LHSIRAAGGIECRGRLFKKHKCSHLAKQKLRPNEFLKNSQKLKNQKKREGAYAPPQFVFSDQMALQARHSHNFVCSVEPT